MATNCTCNRATTSNKYCAHSRNFCGMHPMTLPSLIVTTAYGSWRLPLSCQQCSTSPITPFHSSWFTWYPQIINCTENSKQGGMHIAMVATKEKTDQPRFAKIFPTKYMVTNNLPSINPAIILCYTVYIIK